MIYLSWAALYEGVTDQAYFDVLVPRVLEDAVAAKGTVAATVPDTPAVRLKRGTVDEVAKEACEAVKAFHLIFVHADTGGRGLEAGLESRSTAYCEAIRAKCGFPPVRCVTIAPRHETEAWTLADPAAVMAALGYKGKPSEIGLPSNAAEAERLDDPKSTLASAINRVRGRRSKPDVGHVFPAIAQRQSLTILRDSTSYVAFEARLHAALADMRCIRI